MDINYTQPVAQLLIYGDCRNFKEWPNYLELGLGPEHIPELIRMATDEKLNWSDADTLEIWAPTHAWRALGQLGATEAIEPLLPLFEELEDNDWLHEELPLVYAMIGKAAIPALTRHLYDPSKEMWSRISTARSLQEIAGTDPSVRDEVIAAICQQLERYEENDEELNGFLISYLIDLKAVEAAPLIERVFASERVDLFIQGDWEDVQVELGLKAERETPRSYSFEFPFLQAPVESEKRKSKGVSKAAVKAKSKRKQAKTSRQKNRKRK